MPSDSSFSIDDIRELMAPVSRGIAATREKVADWTGLGDVFSTSVDTAKQYYPEEEHNGRGDAMRHMLASALATQKYGNAPAAALGWANEIFSMDPMEESGMDVYNNALGRELGEKYADRDVLIQKIHDEIEGQKAKTLDGYYKNYSKGGLAKFSQGGLVGDNPFTSKTQGLFQGLDLIHPMNNGSAPLDIPMNNNNMMAKARGGGLQAFHYNTR